MSCDASDVGIGAVLWHKFPDRSERPIDKALKTLSPTQKGYSQIHKEALSIIFGLSKFYQYLYGQHFILFTDHKPLTAIFGLKAGTPLLAANHLSRWALWLNQFDYSIQYRKTSDHGNADVLSRLPAAEDKIFDGEEDDKDTDLVCTIHILSIQVGSLDSRLLTKESGKESVIPTFMRYVHEGWPPKQKETRMKWKSLRKFHTLLAPAMDVYCWESELLYPMK